MPRQPCTDSTVHGPHEWYEGNILRRECPGLTDPFPDEFGPHLVEALKDPEVRAAYEAAQREDRG